jgi:FixJ family two-component response regulator
MGARSKLGGPHGQAMVLVVDDDPRVGESLTALLRSDEIASLSFCSGDVLLRSEELANAR